MAFKEVEESPKKDNLFSATQMMQAVPDKITVAADVKRGAIITAAGALVTAETAADAYAIVAADTVSGGEAPVYLTGEFNSTALAEATGLESITDALKQACRKLCIFIKTNIAE